MERTRRIELRIVANETGRIAQVTRVSVAARDEDMTWTQLASAALNEAERGVLAVAHSMMHRELLEDEEE